MSRSTRMFEVIQLLRSATVPLTAQAMAEQLEVTKRTVYRDVAALQAMRVPIEGEAGVGYVMRSGYDLPPLNFSAEEVEAIAVGLALLGRTGDHGLLRAAASAGQKLGSAIPDPSTSNLVDWPVFASGYNTIPEPSVDVALLRKAVRTERKISISYSDAAGDSTQRILQPLALIYYIEVLVLVAWCELRGDFRHFRVDRLSGVELTGERFLRHGDALRRKWRAQHQVP